MERCRRQFENVFRYLKWRSTRAFDSHSTVKPILWREKKNVNIPQSLKIGGSEELAHLETIRREMELYSSLSDYYPKRPLSEDSWRSLIKCETLKQRIDQVKFFRLNEIKEEKDKEKREKARLERIRENEQSDINSPSFLSTLVSFHESRQREQYQRVVAALRTERGIEVVPRVVIDCRFLPLLSPRGANLTANQIQYIISENRERTVPWPLTLACFDESIEEMRKLKKRKIPILLGPSSWVDVIPDVSEKRLSDLFPPSSCVYLSPDGEEELEEVEEDKVYIIGGIVDRVLERGIPKKASREAANREGIKSVKLPIDKYVKWQSGTRFLTLNAVIGILQEVYDRGGKGEEAWTHAMRRFIPTRNIRVAEEKNPLTRFHHERIREYDRQIREIIDQELKRVRRSKY
ncbi:hypothetical protein PENTCL1PPCAC_26805 [Pristionchus entomophagus]|uniref:SAM-dependent MTase TRM10-type domain-containing protein n=1 Tax=Pristionchus entomophagus TaxID=358040 RepID=A0AAV5UCE7_9BILA|nr:hypothetical protein PENTCL1PPCAC_26805 [Pristionchus entomophagus]